MGVGIAYEPACSRSTIAIVDRDPVWRRKVADRIAGVAKQAVAVEF